MNEINPWILNNLVKINQLKQKKNISKNSFLAPEEYFFGHRFNIMGLTTLPEWDSATLQVVAFSEEIFLHACRKAAQKI